MVFPWLRSRRFKLVLCLVGFLVIGSWLPSATHGVFASPDETAVAVVVRNLMETGRASQPELLAPDIPWLHPRSWMSAGPTLVPVGFLGWPLLLVPLVFVGGSFLLPWLGLLVIASSIYPVFRLFRLRYDEQTAFLGTLLLFSFPTVVLYANRGLFANAPQLALFAWWLFLLAILSPSRQELLSSRKKGAVSLGLGMLTAIVLLLRPVESLWLLPWMGWWGRRVFSQTAHRSSALFWVACAGTLFLYGVFVYRTYGSPFAIGYLLHDNPLVLLEGQTLAPLSSTHPVAWSWRDLLPYGFHPRHIWWNVSSFTRVLLWPWLVGLIFVWGLIASERGKRLVAWVCHERWRNVVYTATQPPVLFGLWTLLVLLVVYGSGLYADHVRPGAVTVGNSFLRYFLPVVPLWVVAFLEGWTRLTMGRCVFLLSRVLILFLIGMGLFTVLVKDDEGLLATRTELYRYTEIRAAAQRFFPPGSVILSDRSDKIFFPVLRAVSPLPASEERIRLTKRTDLMIGLFARPLSQADRDAWRVAGVSPEELQSFGRERLYRLVPLLPY